MTVKQLLVTMNEAYAKDRGRASAHWRGDLVRAQSRYLLTLRTSLFLFTFRDLAGLLPESSTSGFGKVSDCSFLFCCSCSLLDVFSGSISLSCSRHAPSCLRLDA